MTQIGDTIDGKYRVIEQIGEGGMSVVWLVTDSRLNKQWAIKEIKKNARTETHKVIVNSLRAEANLMKGLDHPALPRIVDIIEDGVSLYVVMDYIQGDDLLSVLKSHSRVITEEDVIDWGIQLCDALSYLHNRGIVYRDMKPGNVMLLTDGTVKIIDFGIAREYSPDKEDDTMPLGTRGYASPEAFKKGVQTTPQSDIYSLGVTLFHLVTGHGPMEYIDRPNLPPIREINPTLSPGLEAIIAKATEWDPAERYQSCAEMRVALEDPEAETPDHFRWLRLIWMIFKSLVIASAVCLVLGIGFLVVSNLLKGSSYDDVMVRAATASTQEQGDQPSEAESLYTQAIGIMPGEIEPFDHLVNDVYKADSAFTTSEASRWSRLFEANRGNINGSESYAKLCYDVGIDYFLYYTFANESQNSEEYDNELTRGSQAVSWFEAAINDYDSRQERNQPVTLTESERATAQVYKTIGEFSQRLSIATQEGTEGESYAEYWGALEQAVANLSNSDPVIVRLRLCDVVFSAINSPAYLRGFSRAGVTQTQVESLLDEVINQADALEADASANSTTADLQGHIVDNASEAENNVSSTFNNVGSKAQTGSSGSDAKNGASGSSSTKNTSASGSSSSSGRGTR